MRKEEFSIGDLTVDYIRGGGLDPFTKRFYLDPVNGSDGHDGKAITRAKKSMAAGYALLTTNKNEALYVLPGASVVALTAELDWTKSLCSLIGLGGRNPQGRKVATGLFPTMPGCAIHTATTGVASLLHITGSRNQFYGIQFINAGHADATNLQAVRLGGCLNTAYGNWFGFCAFQGIMGTECNTTANCSLNIGAGASYYEFEDCIIGQNTYGGARATAGQGHLYYPGVYETGAPGAAGYGPQNGIFKRCLFLSRGTTVTVPMVRVETGGNEAMDRTHFFIDCIFQNWTGSAATMNQVFEDGSLSWHNVVLHNCSAHGYTEWQTNNLGLYTTNMPAAAAAGPGIGVQPTS